MQETECFICGSSTPGCTQSSRVQSLRQASSQRGDDVGARLPDDATSFLGHKNCISTYCSKHHIQRYLTNNRKHETDIKCSPNESEKRLRRTSSFDFNHQCIFCGDACVIEPSKKNPTRWREAYLCRTADRKGRCSFQEAILQRADERLDEWGRDVTRRTNAAVSDLHAADGRYHKDCMAKFFSIAPLMPASAVCDSTLNDIVNIMKSDTTRIWNSIELNALYTEKGGSQTQSRFLVNAIRELIKPDVTYLWVKYQYNVTTEERNQTCPTRTSTDVLHHLPSLPGVKCHLPERESDVLHHSKICGVKGTYADMIVRF